MARERSPNRDKAFELYKESNGEIQNREIANILGISEKTVSGWKTKDKWISKLNGVLQINERSTPKEKKHNKKKKEPIAKEVEEVIASDGLTDKQRLFCIYYVKLFNATKAYQKAYDCDYTTAMVEGCKCLRKPKIEEEIKKLKSERMNGAFLTTDDLLQKYIDIAFADISEYVEVEIIERECDDGTVTRWNRIVVNSNFDGSIVTEISQGKDGVKVKLADKMRALDFLAKYNGMLSADVKEKLELEREKLELLRPKEDIEVNDVPFIMPANVIAPPFMSVNFDIDEREHTEYVFTGGRGSTKSSYVSQKLIDRLLNNPMLNAVVMRQVANTLRDSVYAQIQWAIENLGLTDKFKSSLSPLEITYKPTGQKIYFRGADEPTKLKGIKVSQGYIGLLWLEELDQFKGPEAVRTIEQSVIRGGDTAYIFKSFNPPKTKNNWANKYLEVPKDNRLVLHTNYTQVPKKWLGKAFIDEAEYLKEVNLNAYEHEYLGIPNGNGGSVFDNVQIREIPDEEIARFDRLYYGVDWGWYPDPWAFNKVYYDAARRTLYILDEARANKKSNIHTYEILVNEKGIKPHHLITCDNSENKSIEDYRSYGLLARAAIKGPDTVDYSIKWLQSLNAIIIDSNRCPYTATEFLDYEYERDKDGEVISGYPDKNNHHIDAIRYATESIWRRKGQ